MAAWNFFAQEDFDPAWLDGGASRTWYLVFAAGEFFFFSFFFDFFERQRMEEVVGSLMAFLSRFCGIF